MKLSFVQSIHARYFMMDLNLTQLCLVYSPNVHVHYQPVSFLFLQEFSSPVAQMIPFNLIQTHSGPIPQELLFGYLLQHSNPVSTDLHGQRAWPWLWPWARANNLRA
jgi:hypothetical protein